MADHPRRWYLHRVHGFAYAPDGSDFAFQRPRNGDQNNGNAVYVSKNGKTFDATKALARNFNFYVWMPDWQSSVIGGEYGTDSVLWEQPLKGRAQQSISGM